MGGGAQSPCHPQSTSVPPSSSVPSLFEAHLCDRFISLATLWDMDTTATRRGSVMPMVPLALTGWGKEKEELFSLNRGAARKTTTGFLTDGSRLMASVTQPHSWLWLE